MYVFYFKFVVKLSHKLNLYILYKYFVNCKLGLLKVDNSLYILNNKYALIN